MKEKCEFIDAPFEEYINDDVAVEMVLTEREYARMNVFWGRDLRISDIPQVKVAGDLFEVDRIEESLKDGTHCVRITGDPRVLLTAWRKILKSHVNTAI